MAIIAISAPLSGIRGKVGGLVYSANGVGPYVKAWAKGVDPSSALQSVKRRNMSGMATGWRSLSAANRALWVTFAAAGPQALTNSLGETYYISGYLWYVKINRWAFEVGGTVKSVPPVLGKPVAPAAWYLWWRDIAVGASAIRFDGGLTAAYAVAFWRVVPASTPEAVSSGFWMLASGPGPPTVTLPFSWTSTFGAAQTGYRGHFRMYQQSSEGYRSAAQVFSKTFPYTGAIP